MTEEQFALAKRAVACNGWRWMPGMLIHTGFRMVWVDETTFRSFDERANEMYGSTECLLPDITDPATVGCLLALVREAFPGCHAEPNGAPEWDGYDEAERDNWWAVFTCGPHRLMANGATEAEALVAALEAAP